MAVIKIPTTFNIDVEFEVPEFYRRMFALMIDMLVQYIYIRIALEIFKMIAGNSLNSFNENTQRNLSAIAIILAVPVFIYHVVMEITMNGQSIGKKIMGMRVVNENGGRPSISQFLIRWLLRVSDLWILVVLIYFIFWIASSNKDAESTFLILSTLAFLITDIVLVVSGKKNQRIGDILAKTILIRTSQQATIEETVFQEVADTYTPVYPAIMQLNDRDINAIKSILQASAKRNDWAMAAAAADKIRQHLKIESQQDPYDFLETLMKDYNYLSTK